MVEVRNERCRGRGSRPWARSWSPTCARSPCGRPATRRPRPRRAARRRRAAPCGKQVVEVERGHAPEVASRWTRRTTAPWPIGTAPAPPGRARIPPAGRRRSRCRGTTVMPISVPTSARASTSRSSSAFEKVLIGTATAPMRTTASQADRRTGSRSGRGSRPARPCRRPRPAARGRTRAERCSAGGVREPLGLGDDEVGVAPLARLRAEDVADRLQDDRSRRLTPAARRHDRAASARSPSTALISATHSTVLVDAQLAARLDRLVGDRAVRENLRAR